MPAGPIRKVFRTPPEFGPLRMRLQRHRGSSRNAFFNIVVAQARHRTQGLIHDHLGTYYPHPSYTADGQGASDGVGYKHITLDFSRAKIWLANGAEPSSMVSKILSKAGLWPSPPRKVEVMNVNALKHQLESDRDNK